MSEICCALSKQLNNIVSNNSNVSCFEMGAEALYNKAKTDNFSESRHITLAAIDALRDSRNAEIVNDITITAFASVVLIEDISEQARQNFISLIEGIVSAVEFNQDRGYLM